MSFWERLKEDLKKQAEIQKEKAEQKRIEAQEQRERIKQMKKEGIVFCPKCKSTSVQYVERRKRLSLGRAIVGGVLTGGWGAAVGAVTSKKYKGYVKCLNCGYMWKK